MAPNGPSLRIVSPSIDCVKLVHKENLVHTVSTHVMTVKMVVS
ncbi:hypothetical protein ANCCAN_22425 [Ancylostoma caninum]|uniref:Uncharacterized protein n=1 Tax=Ancylostoma caninum TaxID=29170 RepID=A0A368FNM3_ANCCA|nr:hypothetical protein ANCCAN_22425 [Ancylostoma caninum]